MPLRSTEHNCHAFDVPGHIPPQHRTTPLAPVECLELKQLPALVWKSHGAGLCWRQQVTSKSDANGNPEQKVMNGDVKLSWRRELPMHDTQYLACVTGEEPTAAAWSCPNHDTAAYKESEPGNEDSEICIEVPKFCSREKTPALDKQNKRQLSSLDGQNANQDTYLRFLFKKGKVKTNKKKHSFSLAWSLNVHFNIHKFKRPKQGLRLWYLLSKSNLNQWINFNEIQTFIYCGMVYAKRTELFPLPCL